MTARPGLAVLLAALLCAACSERPDGFVGDDDTTAGDDDDAIDDDSGDDDDSAPHPVAEARGAWIWASPFGNDPVEAAGAIDTRIHEMVDTGFNLLFPLAKAGSANYPSEITAVSEGWESFDFPGVLRDTAAAASPDGRVEVHPWTCVYYMGSLLEEHPEYAAVQLDGTPDGAMACPTRPEVRERALAVVEEILTRYDVDGIHLDYVRQAAPDTCYCDLCRAEFQALHGVDPVTLPQDDPDWVTFRVAQVTAFVEQVRVLADAHDPPRLVSAAVFNKPTPTEGRVDFGQDWVDWLDRGLLDFAVPMNYTDDHDFFTEIGHGALDHVDPSHHVYLGIGLYLFEEEQRDGAVEQIEIARTLGADGTVMFRAESINDVFSQAAAEVWATPAYPPHALP